MSVPILSIAIISCNRFFYLKSLIESIQHCVQDIDFELIVVDNASSETGLREYLERCSVIDQLYLRPERQPTSEFAAAQNIIIERATGKYLLPLTDDMQFILKGKWIKEAIEIAEKYTHIGSIVIDAQRRRSIEDFFIQQRWKRYLPISKPKTYSSPGSLTRLFSYGKKKTGVTPSAANSLTRLEIWKKLGGFKSTHNLQTVGDSSGGAENEMHQSYLDSGLNLERCILELPVMADIYTDMRGTQARIRGNRRFGNYFPPPDGNFYYHIHSGRDLSQFRNRGYPATFEEVVQPLGFDLPIDADGHLLKNPLGQGDNYQLIDA